MTTILTSFLLVFVSKINNLTIAKSVLTEIANMVFGDGVSWIDIAQAHTYICAYAFSNKVLKP